MTPEKSNVPQQVNATTESAAGSPHTGTFRENAILTMKLLMVVALLGAALWAVELWTVAG